MTRQNGNSYSPEIRERAVRMVMEHRRRVYLCRHLERLRLRRLPHRRLCPPHRRLAGEQGRHMRASSSMLSSLERRAWARAMRALIGRPFGFLVGDRCCGLGLAELPQVVVKGNTGSKVWADTAYRSKKNEAWLARNGFVSDIRHNRGMVLVAEGGNRDVAAGRSRGTLLHAVGRACHGSVSQTGKLGAVQPRNLGMLGLP
jgi:hypothetical protein